jgi:ubiquinone/menaquinone biosynthesis C-methylase UbiE/3-hydroxymyristoyl/3-hydroxydecanoyl-(acyl carrier protein) dehydratase
VSEPPGERGPAALKGYIDCLPQKPPFLFLDELEELAAEESAAGAISFAAGHPVFENHLPGNPLVPGVILIEALAQLSGIVLIPAGGPEPVLGYLGEVKRMRFRRKVRPGERVHLRSRLLHRFAGAARFAVEARVGGELAAEGELILAGGTREHRSEAGDPRKDRVKAQFGAAAADYATSDIHARGESLRVLVEGVRPQPHWEALDVATGAGHCALAFAPRVRRVVALDLTGPMLETTARIAAERRLSNVETRAGDAEALPFPDASFDLLTCRLAFHHFPHPALAAREFARVLKPGGTLGLTDNIVLDDPEAAAAYNDFEKLRDPSHHQVLPLGALIQLLERAGLQVISSRWLVKEFEFHHWADRQRVSAGDKEKLLEMARGMPQSLLPLLAPRWEEGTLHFSLWETVIVGRKLRLPAGAAG